MSRTDPPALAAQRATLESHLRQTPNDAAALEQLAILQFQLADHASAIRTLSQAIELRPASAATWNNLGVMREATGDFAGAEAAYRHAIELQPATGVLHFNRANALRSLGRWPEAEASFRQCLALTPQHAEARHNLGALLKERGDHAAALVELQAAVSAVPQMIDAQVNLGATLQALGRDEDALTAYRAALQLSPGYPDAAAGEIAALDRLGRIDEACALLEPRLAAAPNHPDLVTTFAVLAPRLHAEEEAVKALEKLLTAEHLLPSKRQAALYSLGRLCDRLGRYPEAFKHYQAANDLRARPFDLPAFRAYVSDIKSNFTRLNLRHLPRVRRASDLPIFVVGMPRSGTTLVEQILASHPEVHGAGELTWLDEAAETLPTRLASSATYPACIVDASLSLLEQLAHQYLDQLRDLAPAAKRIVDKMPGNFAHLGLVELLFPEARVIHIRRAPLDNCLSCYFQNFTRGHEYTTDLSQLGAVYREYESLMQHWREHLSLPVLEVQYEELVDAQEAQTRRLIDFCGLQWDSHCLRFHETRRVVRTASYDQVRRPMYRDSLARHRHYESFLEPLRKALNNEGSC